MRIPCFKCGGSGKIELPEHLTRVLRAVQQGRTTAEKIHPAIVGSDTVRITAVNNRLEQLRSLGFVSRHREGRYWHYTTTKKGNNNGSKK